MLEAPNAGDRLALLAELLDDHARVSAAPTASWRDGAAPAGYPSRHDAELRRRRGPRPAQSDQERVQGLIEHLREEGLDQEEAEQVGDCRTFRTHPADQGSDTFEREKDMAILEHLERELAEIEAALQRLDEGTYGDRRGHRRSDRAPSGSRRTRSRTNVDTANVDTANVDTANVDRAVDTPSN